MCVLRDLYSHKLACLHYNRTGICPHEVYCVVCIGYVYGTSTVNPGKRKVMVTGGEGGGEVCSGGGCEGQLGLDDPGGEGEGSASLMGILSHAHVGNLPCNR